MAYGVSGPFNHPDPDRVYLGDRAVSHQGDVSETPKDFFSTFIQQAHFPATEATDAKGNIQVTVQVDGQELTYSSAMYRTKEAFVNAFNADMACLALNKLDGVEVVSMYDRDVKVSHQGIAVNVRLYSDEGDLLHLEGSTFDASAFLEEFKAEFGAKKSMASVVDGRPYRFQVKDPGKIPLPTCLRPDLFIETSHGGLPVEPLDAARYKKLQEEAPER